MAKNCAKIEDLPVIVGSKTREVKSVTLDDCKGMGEAFDTYTLQDGDVIQFPALEDLQIFHQEVRPKQDSYITLVGCMRTRGGETKPSYFNVNSLHKRDVNNQPVYPEWYNLGDIKERIKELCKRGSIKCTGMMKYNAAVFEDNKVKMVPNDEGELVRAFEEKDAPIIA
jgi:hypothetical protein